jgi:hypothetical protein
MAAQPADCSLLRSPSCRGQAHWLGGLLQLVQMMALRRIMRHGAALSGCMYSLAQMHLHGSKCDACDM